jgi:hypothetical protein
VLCLLFCLFSQPACAQLESLSFAQIHDQEILELRGNWDFFWGEWIEPGDESPASQKASSACSWAHHPEPPFK